MSHHTPEGYAASRTDRLLTVDEMADLLHVSRPTLYRLIRIGALSPVRIGRRFRFEPAEIRRYLDESKVAVAP